MEAGEAGGLEATAVGGVSGLMGVGREAVREAPGWEALWQEAPGVEATAESRAGGSNGDKNGDRSAEARERSD